MSDSATLWRVGSSVLGILQARVLEWVAISSSRGSPRLRDRTHVYGISGIGRWILYQLRYLGSLRFGERQILSFPSSSVVKNLPTMQDTGFDLCIRKIPWRRKWHPTPVFLPEKSHGQRSLAGYSAWGHRELGKTS